MALYAHNRVINAFILRINDLHTYDPNSQVLRSRALTKLV